VSDSRTFHYRRKKSKDHPGGGPLCGAFEGKTPPEHRLCKVWPDLFDGEIARPNACQGCLDARNAKPADAAEDSQTAAQAPPSSPDLVADTKAKFTVLAAGLLNGALYEAQKAPLDSRGDQAVAGTVHSFVDVLEHYGVLGYTAHPVIGLIVNGYFLLKIVQAQPKIENRDDLNRAFGLPLDPKPDQAPQAPPERDAA
jgi:hypothetical protein